MKASKLRQYLPPRRKMVCSKCPIPKRTCDAIAKGLWGEENCLLRVVLREILLFHTKDETPPPKVVHLRSPRVRKDSV